MIEGRISGLGRLVGCPGSRYLKQDPPGERAEEAATHGTLLHSVLDGGDIPSIAAKTGEEVEHLEWLRKRFQGWETEVPVAYSTTKRVGHVFKTDDDMVLHCRRNDEKWITGHIDAMLVDLPNNRVSICDVKTGTFCPELDDPQLLGYAVALVAAIVTEARNKDTIVNRFKLTLSILHWPKTGHIREFYLKTFGDPYKEIHREVDLDEIVEFASAIREGLADPNRLTVGTHCVYCPSANYCPVQGPKGSKNV